MKTITFKTNETKKKEVKVANALYRFGENASKQNTVDTAKVKKVDNNHCRNKICLKKKKPSR